MILSFLILLKRDIRKIVDIELSKLTKRIDDLGYKIEISNSAKDFIVEKDAKNMVQDHLIELFKNTLKIC